MNSLKPVPIFIAVMLILGAALSPCFLLFAPPSVEAQKAALGTIADISGSGSAVKLATSGSAHWIQFTAPTGNASAVRYGDSNVSSSRGAIIAAGGGDLLPVLHVPGGGQASDSLYQFSTIYVYIASGDSLSVTWGN